jgi:hypothetical protein
MPACPPEHEHLLEPGNVSDLPQQGVHNGQLRPDHPIVVEIGHQRDRPLTRVLDPAGELIGI